MQIKTNLANKKAATEISHVFSINICFFAEWMQRQWQTKAWESIVIRKKDSVALCFLESL
jgi:hypothetical protein